MSTFRSILTSSRRGYILQILASAGGGCNERVLLDACRAGFQPHGITGDLIRSDLDWLQSAGCVTIAWIDETLALPALTGRGKDVANGHLEVDGITLDSR